MTIIPPRASEPYLTASEPLITETEVLPFMSTSGAWSIPHCCPVWRAPLLIISIRFPYIPWITGWDTVVPVLMELTPLMRSSRVVSEVPSAFLISGDERRLLTALSDTPVRSPVITTSPISLSMTNKVSRVSVGCRCSCPRASIGRDAAQRQTTDRHTYW